jgi:hypothetical protein
VAAAAPARSLERPHLKPPTWRPARGVSSKWARTRDTGSDVHLRVALAAAASTPQQAAEELRRCAGTQFDPAAVDAFRAVLAARTLQPAGAPLA